LATALALMLMVALPVMAEGIGSANVNTGETYTLEQMLTYAMEDEYMAQAEYQAIMATYGANAPFANTVRAEATHIVLLQQLFASYGIALPENTAAAKTTVPATLPEAYQAGIAAENANIAMYDAFLAQADLPKDVSDTFEALRNASRNHLAAFTRNSERDGAGMRSRWNDDGNTNGRGNGRGQGRGQDKAQGNNNCPIYGAQRNRSCNGNCANRGN
jgi:hypothetical protein